MVIQEKTNLFFTLFIGLSVLGYIIPVHSPYGHDFFTNSLSFTLIAIGAIPWLLKQSLNFYNLTILTWITLAGLIMIQPMFNYIRYPDALIFPSLSLVMISISSLIFANIDNKKNILNILSYFVYITLIITFTVQIMQIFNYQITWNNWPITRLAAINGRMDGNFGQANHAAYAFVLGLCFVIYQLNDNSRNARKVVLFILFVIFTIGIALTKSRANIIMVFCSILIFYFSQSQALITKAKNSIGMIIIFFLGYVLGGLLLSHLAPKEVSVFGAVSRINEGGFYEARLSLLHRAWLIFQDHPIIGAGWNNFLPAGISYAEQVKWFTFSNDAHMLFFQIGSELGILGLLCLLPIVWILINAIHFKHSKESAMALAFVVASILYSFSEYPLWYFRYLIIFAVFISIIEQKQYAFPKLNYSFSKTLVAFCLIMSLAATFYSYNYLTSGYLFYQYDLDSRKVSEDGRVYDDYDVPIYGFTNYGEMSLSSVISIDQGMLPQKLGLFERVINMDFSQYNAFSYGQLLTYDRQYDKALTMFKAACLLDAVSVKCDNVTIELYRLAVAEPESFKYIYIKYADWLKVRGEWK